MASNEWLAILQTNINGMYFLTKAVVPLLKNKKHIINIGSILGTTGKEEASSYSASKYAVQGFSDSLYKELRFDGIKVTCINPGSIETNLLQSSGIAAHANMLQPTDLANTIINILEIPDNMLIQELTIRPLNHKHP